MQPTPTGDKYLGELDPAIFNKVSNAIYEAYDGLDFGNLSWTYWHAIGSTPHMGPAHFGAAIEMLIRAFQVLNPKAIPSAIVSDRKKWKAINSDMRQLIKDSDLDLSEKKGLTESLATLNNVPLRLKIAAVFEFLGLNLSPAEDAAWRRRNSAAHGTATSPGDELVLIHEIRLLKVLFHRLLLRMTNSSDRYFDYTAAGFPIREITHPASGVAPSANGPQ